MWKKNISCLITSVILTLSFGQTIKAQIPILDQFKDYQQLWGQIDNKQVSSQCIRLDSRCVFEIAPLEGDFSQRVGEIQNRLQDISAVYFRSKNGNLNIRSEEVGNLENIYIKVDQQEVRLLTVTQADADLSRVTIKIRTEQIIDQLYQDLEKGKQERQFDYILIQGGIATATGAAMILASLLLSRWEKKLKHSRQQYEPKENQPSQPLSTKLTLSQKWHLTSVKCLLIQIAQGFIWLGGSLLILDLFPYTRAFQLLIILALKFPLRLGITGLFSYVIIRLSYSLIDNFSSSLASNYILTREANQRLQLRITTLSGVTKSLVTVTSVSLGVLIGLAWVGINIGPLLAGAGIIGVAISLAAQNIIRDTINGFCIIIEDQYAIGDVVSIGNFSGLVESINLRITQLRDGEGRLITIPNSEIRAVANMSSQWSRADLNIPIAYHTDVDRALQLIHDLADHFFVDPQWGDRILETPLVLGVDNFGDRGIIIKVWIKTQPLKQWEVAREFRRRVKIAFDEAGIPILPPQQQIWLHTIDNE